MMDEMTEAEWQRAERREPGKTYVEPELAPLHRFVTGRNIWIVAFLLASVVIWSALTMIPAAVDGWKGYHVTTQEVAAEWPRG